MTKERSTESVWVSRIQTVLFVALCIYGANLCAQLIWFLAAPADQSVLYTNSAGIAEVRERSISRPIGRYNLFGKPGESTEKKEVPVTAPKTRLRLVLQGVVTADENNTSGAIIEEIGKSTDYYKIGDKVAGSATLEEVYSDRVILERSGRYETLSFDEAAAAAKGVKTVKSVPKVAKRRGSIDSPEQFLTEATRRLNKNPKQALASVGLALSDEGGYVYQGNNSMLSGLNLQKGDVLMSVNGHTLGNLKQDKDVMQSLYEQGNVEVEVVRDGASFYVNYPLR